MSQIGGRKFAPLSWCVQFHKEFVEKKLISAKIKDSAVSYIMYIYIRVLYTYVSIIHMN